MSHHRHAKIPFSSAPRGTCRWCGKDILKSDGLIDRRRRWHTPCSDEYKMSWPSVARGKVWMRDEGVCADCGIQCAEINHLSIEQAKQGLGMNFIYEETGERNERGWPIRKSRPMTEAEFHERYLPGWAADHIVPLVDGGTFDIENLQTLCLACHKQKTAREASARAGK